MKKIWSALAAACMLLTLCACGGDGTGDKGGEIGSRNSPPVTDNTTEMVYDDSYITESIAEGRNVDAGNGVTFQYSFHVPQLKGDTGTIRAINAELDEVIGSQARDALEELDAGGEPLGQSIAWDSFWKDSLLSLRVRLETTDQIQSYYMFNYDFKEDARLDARALLARIGIDSETFLRAARRAAIQEFDRRYGDWTKDSASAALYYTDYYHDGSCILMERSRTADAVELSHAMLCLDGDTCQYIAPIFSSTNGAGFIDYCPLELDFTSSTVTRQVMDDIAIATLEKDHVYVSFTDTEMAAWYISGGWNDEADEPARIPFDAPIQTGEEYQYEVQGLYSHYTDIYFGLFGTDYTPYLILVTDQNTLEMVDIIRGALAGVFCAMPIPGRFELAADTPFRSELIEGANYDLYTVIVSERDGTEYDLSTWVTAARYAVPEGIWSGALEEKNVDGGSYSVIGNWQIFNTGSTELTITELDMVTEEYNGVVSAIGMTEDGIICLYDLSPLPRVSGGLAYRCSSFMGEDGYSQFLRVKIVSGVPPCGYRDEWVDLYQVESYASGYEYEQEGEGYESGYPMEEGEFDETFTGNWDDSVSGRCEMSIRPAYDGTGTYTVTIHWGDSAFDTYQWEMTAVPADDEAAMYYEDCVEKKVTLNEDSTYSEEILSTGGSGSIILERPGVLIWQDENFSRSRDCVFVLFDGHG